MKTLLRSLPWLALANCVLAEQDSEPRPASATQAAALLGDHERLRQVRRDCTNASYADEPSIADVFERSGLVIIGSPGLRMYLDESSSATGTDWDAGQFVREVRIHRIIKGSAPGPSVVVVYVETPQFPLNYATMLARWRESAILFLRKAERDGLWELACKEPVHADVYPAVPSDVPDLRSVRDAQTPRERLIATLSANLRTADLRGAWRCAKVLRDLGVLPAYSSDLANRLDQLLTVDYERPPAEAPEFLSNVACLDPQLVRQTVRESLSELSEEGRRLLLEHAGYVPGPEPGLAELFFQVLESEGGRGSWLGGLADHIVPSQSERLAALFANLKASEKGMASFALVKVLDGKTLPLYLENIRQDRSGAWYAILRADQTIEPRLQAHRAPILRELVASLARKRDKIAEYPNQQLPEAVWRLANGDPTLPSLTRNVQKDADALLMWWEQAKGRYQP